MEELKVGRPWYANGAGANQSNKITLPNWDEERLHYLGRVSCLITRNGMVIQQWCNGRLRERERQSMLHEKKRKLQWDFWMKNIEIIKYIKEKVWPCPYVCDPGWVYISEEEEMLGKKRKAGSHEKPKESASVWFRQIPCSYLPQITWSPGLLFE